MMNALTLTHLRMLEAESIHILREVAAEFQRPVMLYSIGKDSSVLVRLAQKAFFPGKIPFPLLHIDTTYKFKEMIEFRDRFCVEIGAKLIDTVRIDTTHFVCTEARGQAWEKAVEMNVPVVVPDWIKGCEREGKIVGVRGYYLDADPKLRQMGPSQVQQAQRPSLTNQLSARDSPWIEQSTCFCRSNLDGTYRAPTSLIILMSMKSSQLSYAYNIIK